MLLSAASLPLLNTYIRSGRLLIRRAPRNGTEREVLGACFFKSARALHISPADVLATTVRRLDALIHLTLTSVADRVQIALSRIMDGVRRPKPL